MLVLRIYYIAYYIYEYSMDNDTIMNDSDMKEKNK